MRTSTRLYCAAFKFDRSYAVFLSRLMIAAILLVVMLACAQGADAGNEPVGENTSLHFWDPIPVSPSTTVPAAIKDDYWHGQFQRVNRAVAAAHKTELIFFGDSITWYWSEGKGKGQAVWDEKFSAYNPINMGNSGDITPVMLYRVTHGNLDFAKGQAPKVAVLLCGVNNFGVTQSDGGKVKWDLGADCPPTDIANGVRAIAQVFRRRLPQTRLIMLGIFPVANQAKWEKCQQVNAINAARVYNTDEMIFVELREKFLQADGTINRTLYTDGTHLTTDGYQAWAQGLEPIVANMMQAEMLKPVKIMLIGDSITEGANSATAYRRYLDGMLRRYGHLIDFVGSQKKHNNNQIEADNYEYDVDHEAHWGKDSAWMAQHMPALLTDDAPDMAVIHLGTEDIAARADGAALNTESIIQNTEKVIAALRAKNPNVNIVVAKIIPVHEKTEAVNKLNLALSAFTQSHSTVASPVVLADPNTGFDVATDLLPDGKLPNASGAKKMAQAFAEAINGMLIKK